MAVNIESENFIFHVPYNTTINPQFHVILAFFIHSYSVIFVRNNTSQLISKNSGNDEYYTS